MKHKLKQQLNTLAIFIHSLVSQYATFELQTNCLVYGKVDHVDDDLNVTLGDVTLQRLNSRCSSQLEMMFIHSKTIRYIHLPDDLNVDENVTKQFQRTMAKNSVNFRPIKRLSTLPDSASRTNSNNQHASGKFDPEATRKRSNGENGRQISITNVGLEKTDQKVAADLNSSTAKYHHSRSTQESPSGLAPLPLLPSTEEHCDPILKLSPTINNLYNEEPSLTGHLDQNNPSMNSPCLYTPVPTDHDPAEEYIIDRHDESPKCKFTDPTPAADFNNRKRQFPDFDAVSETVNKSDISGPVLKKVKIEKLSGDKPKSDQPSATSKVSTSSVVPSPDATDDEEEAEKRNDDDDNLNLKELKRKQQLFVQSGHAKAKILKTTHEVSKPTKTDSLSQKMENGARRSKAPLTKRDKELNELLESTVQFAPRYVTRRSKNPQPEPFEKSNIKRKNAKKGEIVKYTDISGLRRGRSSRGNGRNK